VLATTLAGCSNTDCDTFRFDNTTWDGHTGVEENSPRRALAAGLVECKWLPGKPRREIRDGLGPPYDHAGKRLWAYAIGSPDQMASEPSELIIRFDPEGRVKGAHIER